MYQIGNIDVPKMRDNRVALQSDCLARKDVLMSVWETKRIGDKLSKFVISRKLIGESPQMDRSMGIQVPMLKFSNLVFYVLATPFLKKEGAAKVADDLIKCIRQPGIWVHDDG